MNRNDRLQRLEQAAAKRKTVADTPVSFPSEWMDLDENGDWKGPPKGGDPKEVLTYRTVRAMYRTIA
jgi:hypothetical protein